MRIAAVELKRMRNLVELHTIVVLSGFELKFKANSSSRLPPTHIRRISACVGPAYFSFQPELQFEAHRPDFGTSRFSVVLPEILIRKSEDNDFRNK
jgi:hypothetical protein